MYQCVQLISEEFQGFTMRFRATFKEFIGEVSHEPQLSFTKVSKVFQYLTRRSKDLQGVTMRFRARFQRIISFHRHFKALK